MGLSWKTLRRAIDRGDLVAAKLGRVWRLRQADLDAWFERQNYVPPEGGSLVSRPEVGSLAALRRIEAT